MLLQTTCSFNRINKQLLYDLPPFFLGLLLNMFILSNSFAQASQHERLLFLGNKNIAPVVYLDNGLPSGVVVDIVHALAKHISQPLAIMAMDWSEAQALVARGEADALMQINATEERNKIYDFSDTLLESQFSIFTPTNRVGISGISSLRGLRVGVESGGLPQLVLKEDPLVKLDVIPNFLQGFKLLNEAALDAVVVDYRVGSYVLAENKIRNIKVTGKPIASSFSSIAVKKGNAQLLDEINTGLRIIKADGTYQNILDNWKPKESFFYSREQITNVILYAALLSLLILLLIAVLWIVTFKKEFTQKKAAEEKLREQYSTLRSIIDSANALIFSVDRQYRYTSFNLGHAAAMKALYGAEIKQGQNLLEYMTVPEDREIAKRNIDRALTGKQLVEEAYSGEELRFRQYFQVSHSPIKTHSEEIIGVAVLGQDITARKHGEESLCRLNRELRAISDCNQTLIRAEDEQTLLNDICHIICDKAGYRMAWVGYAEFDDAKTVRPVAWAGNEDGYLADANITWADTERGRGPSGTAIRSGESAYIQDFATDPKVAPWRENALLRGYRSSIGLPLKDESAKAFGVLTIYSMELNAFTNDETHLLEKLAKDLAFGLMVLRTRTERKLAEEALSRLNEELDLRVKQRTAELEQKNAELEKMNRLFVGRELRMKELKEKIVQIEGENISE